MEGEFKTIKEIDPDRILRVTEKSMEAFVLIVEGAAVKMAPVDTGRLRSSIHSKVDSEKKIIIGEVATPVEYAEHIEFGTSKTEPQPFLRPAVLKNLRKFNKILKKYLNEN